MKATKSALLLTSSDEEDFLISVDWRRHSGCDLSRVARKRSGAEVTPAGQSSRNKA